MNSELERMWRERGRGINLDAIPVFGVPGGIEENLIQDGRYQGQDLNSRLFKFVVGMLGIRM
jgi:hypothetical protein